MSRMNYNEIAQLVENVKNGSADSFTELYNKTYPHIYSLSIQITRDFDITQDVIQEVYINAYQNINDLKNSKLFMAWIYKITYHESLKLITDSKLQTVSYEELEQADLPMHEGPLDILLVNEKRSYIVNKIYDLKEDYRIVLIMKYFYNLKIKEIAYVLNCPEGTIKSRINTAKKQLKSSIDRTQLYSINGFLVLYGLAYIRETPAKIQTLLEMNPTKLANEFWKGTANNPSLIPVPPAGLTHSAAPAFLYGSAAGLVGISGIIGGVTLYTPELVHVQSTLSSNYSEATIHINTRNDYAISNILVDNGSQSMTPSHTRENKYELTVSRNQTYQIHITGKTGKVITSSIAITEIDDQPPEIDTYKVTSDTLRVYVSDQKSGIDYSQLYLSIDDTIIKPDKQNTAQSYAEFTSLPEDTYTLHIFDVSGNSSSYTVRIKYSEPSVNP